jgi:hypothetical protein
LEKGDLKGTRSPNPYGVNEWRIYPNKEILEKLKAGNGSQGQVYFGAESEHVAAQATEQFEKQPFHPQSVYQTPGQNSTAQGVTGGQPASMVQNNARVQLEAGSVGTLNMQLPLESDQRSSDGVMVGSAESGISEVVDAELSGEVGGDIRSWLSKEREVIRALAEEMVKPIVEQLQRKDKELQDASFRLGYLEGVMKDQEEQIKLLPDYQARAEEAERLKEQLEGERAETRLARERADEERKQAEVRALEIETLKKQILALDEERALTLEGERRIAAETSKRAEELAMEMERLKAEKEAEAKAIHIQLSSVITKLEKLEQPWWKKWFTPGE